MALAPTQIYSYHDLTHREGDTVFTTIPEASPAPPKLRVSGEDCHPTGWLPPAHRQRKPASCVGSFTAVPALNLLSPWKGPCLLCLSPPTLPCSPSVQSQVLAECCYASHGQVLKDLMPWNHSRWFYAVIDPEQRNARKVCPLQVLSLLPSPRLLHQGQGLLVYS